MALFTDLFRIFWETEGQVGPVSGNGQHEGISKGLRKVRQRKC